MNAILFLGSFLLVFSFSSLYGQSQKIDEIRNLYNKTGQEIAAGQFMQHQMHLESLIPGIGEKRTQVHFYYSLVQEEKPDGDEVSYPLLAKITLEYSLAASASYYSEFLFNQDLVFYYSEADGYECRETRFYLDKDSPVKIKVNRSNEDCVADTDQKKALAFERLTDFTDEDLANIKGVIAKAAEYSAIFAGLTRLDRNPRPTLSFSDQEQYAGPVFSSVYTDLPGTDCRDLDEPLAEGDIPQICAGVDGYQLYTYYNLYGHDLIHLQTIDENFDTSLVGDDCDDTQIYGDKIEWRLANGRPFAAVVRTTCHYLTLAEEDGIEFEMFEAGDSYLLVRGLAGFESINHSIKIEDADTANQDAREMADIGYTQSR
jgi:hypothetical protein